MTEVSLGCLMFDSTYVQQELTRVLLSAVGLGWLVLVGS